MPVTCPIGRSDAGTHGHSGTPAFTMTCIGTALAAYSHSLPSWSSRGRRVSILNGAVLPTTNGTGLG